MRECDDEQTSADDGWDERFAHGFDPTTAPAVRERLTRICSVVLGETTQNERAKKLGDESWLTNEATSMANLLLETIQLRLTDLDEPSAPTKAPDDPEPREVGA